MKKLIDKYIDNKLTPEEIETTREWLATHTDDQLAQPMYESWRDFEPGKADCDSGLEDRVYQKLSKEIFAKRRRSLWRTIYHIAGVLVLALLAYGTLTLYHVNSEIKDQMLAAATRTGQQATITLPDGSTVSLNGASTISYKAEDFVGDRRMVSFEGEAFFDITKQAGAEFVIDADDLTVTVHGTTFNLASRKDAPESAIYLLTGNVEIRSKLTNQSIELHENEKAVINRATGEIVVDRIGTNDNPTAWQSHRLVFDSASFGDVLKQVEKNYGVEIECGHEHPSETFTGMIPLDNLDVAKDIIEGTFHTEISVSE